VTSEIIDAMLEVPRVDIPDMPDRIVAATAIYFGGPAISRDGRIRTSSVQTVW
jgi:PIN domain nuclease of toxin-antitoxin system